MLIIGELYLYVYGLSLTYSTLTGDLYNTTPAPKCFKLGTSWLIKATPIELKQVVIVVDSSLIGPVPRKLFPFDDVITYSFIPFHPYSDVISPSQYGVWNPL